MLAYQAQSYVSDADSSTAEARTDTNLRARQMVLRVLQFLQSLPGVESARLRESAADLGNVVFLGRLARENAARCLKAAEALLVHLTPEPLFDITIPSKIQTYLAAGRPIVAGVRGDAADLVSDAGAGVLCTPGDPASIAGAVEKLASMPALELEKMGERGRTYYQEVLSERRAVEATHGILAEAVEAHHDVITLFGREGPVAFAGPLFGTCHGGPALLRI